jgi:hypothetical protein
VPILFFILIIILIAQVGFWNTLGAIAGAALMVVVLIVLIAAIVALGGYLFVRRMR